MSTYRQWSTMVDFHDGRMHLVPSLDAPFLWPSDHPCNTRSVLHQAGATPTCLWCVAYWIRNG